MDTQNHLTSTRSALAAATCGAELTVSGSITCAFSQIGLLFSPKSVAFQDHKHQVHRRGTNVLNLRVTRISYFLQFETKRRVHTYNKLILRPIEGVISVKNYFVHLQNVIPSKTIPKLTKMAEEII